MASGSTRHRDRKSIRNPSPLELKKYREEVFGHKPQPVVAPVVILNEAPVQYDSLGFPILSGSIPEETGSGFLDDRTEELYVLQEELERAGESKEQVRQRKRETSYHHSKDGFSIAVNGFYKLLKSGLRLEALQDDSRFNRILIRTRNLRGLLSERPDILEEESSSFAKIIFKSRQRIEGEDEKIKEKFSMLVSNFLNLCPKSRHHLSIFAEQQASYENDLQLIYSTLKTALESRTLSEGQFAPVLRIPDYVTSLKKVPGLKKKSIVETTANIAVLLHQLNRRDYSGCTQDGISALLYHIEWSLRWSVYGLTKLLDELNKLPEGGEQPGVNGQKSYQPFVNRPPFHSYNKQPTLFVTHQNAETATTFPPPQRHSESQIQFYQQISGLLTLARARRRV